MIGHGLGNYKLSAGLTLIHPTTKEVLVVQVEAYGNTLHKGSWWVVKESGDRTAIPGDWLIRSYYPKDLYEAKMAEES